MKFLGRFYSSGDQDSNIVKNRENLLEWNIVKLSLKDYKGVRACVNIHFVIKLSWWTGKGCKGFSIPLTSVENERGFSKVNKIQSKFTNSISPKNLYYRVLINASKIIAEFDFDMSLKIFFEGKRRNGSYRKAFRYLLESNQNWFYFVIIFET